jgi:hypothetical protein
MDIPSRQSWSDDDTCSDGDWQHRSMLIRPLLLYAMKLFALTPAALVKKLYF